MNRFCKISAEVPPVPGARLLPAGARPSGGCESALLRHFRKGERGTVYI